MPVPPPLYKAHNSTWHVTPTFPFHSGA